MTGAIRSSLGRHVAEAPASPEQLQQMAAAVWRKTGKVFLDPATITDEWLRQAVVNEANRLYGKRGAGR